MSDYNYNYELSKGNFVIGVIDGYDSAYDWLLPFGLKVDWANTQIGFMPEAEVTSIEMPGFDGSIAKKTVYRDRPFNIVAFSEDGLTRLEKEALKSRIASILDSTKNKKVKLLIQRRGSSFNVKYEGQASISDGPSFIKVTIPLVSEPYGTSATAGSIKGSGKVYNSGVTDIGVTHTIVGPVSGLTFTFNGNEFKYENDIEEGSTLTIDSSSSTCYITSKDGTKKNAMRFLKGNISKIKVGPKRTANVNVSGDAAGKFTTVWRNKILW